MNTAPLSCLQYGTLDTMTYPQGIPTAKTMSPGACIAAIEPDSPAARATLEPGMYVLSVDGEPLRDILDWYWLTDELEIELEIAMQDESRGSTEVVAPDNTESIVLTRTYDEPWGIAFSEILFDGLKQCVNNCSFCFMKMLPKGMRSALYVRDDDYRLSFLHGNFVTLTNLTDEDIERIVHMHLSPLNVSIHAINPEVRQQLMGKQHARGIEALEELLAAGIECKAQVVLVPGINDGTVLTETLEWIAEHSGIITTGIVPYGYTRYAKIQQGFDTPASARAVIDQVKALAPEVQLADEFFIKAWPGEILSHLPSARYYADYPMIEDGIGMLRQWIDENRAEEFASLASEGVLVTGEAFAAVLRELLPNSNNVIAVKNEFFGGNVDVAGLLTAEDIMGQWRESTEGSLILPAALFNDEGLTLDNKAATDIAAELNSTVKVLD